jgi:glutamine synthetase
MVFRSLLEKHSLKKGLKLDPATSFTSSNLIFTKNSEPMVGGVYEFALSELAWYAAGGVIKHQLALAGIARATMWQVGEGESKVGIAEFGERLERCAGTLTENDPASLVSVHYASLDPRQRALQVRGLPSNGCPYTLLSAILLAMIDGILNKVVPVTVGNAESLDVSKGFNKNSLADCLRKDCEFLAFCEVFPDTLVQALVENLS